MIKGLTKSESVLLFSHNAKLLAEFYRNKVGFPLVYKTTIVGHKEVYLLEMLNGSTIYISDMADKLTDKDILRNVLNFEVEEIEAETRRMDDIGVKKINNLSYVRELGLVSVFNDLDGNHIQLIQASVPALKSFLKRGLLN